MLPQNINKEMLNPIGDEVKKLIKRIFIVTGSTIIFDKVTYFLAKKDKPQRNSTTFEIGNK
jgi:hypothetical protein